MTGDEEILKVWQLEGTIASIEAVTSQDQVTDRLTWTSGKGTHKLNEVLAWFEESDDPEFSKVRGQLADILNDADFRCAYEHLLVGQSGEVLKASLWMCSPSKKLLLFLEK